MFFFSSFYSFFINLCSRVFFFTVHKTEDESSAMQVNVYLKNQLRRLRRPIPEKIQKSALLADL